LATYCVSDLGGNEPRNETVEGLTAAKLYAETRALASDVPVVVLERDSGRELARYPAGRQRGSQAPHAPPSRRPSEAVLRLRAANDRLQDNVEMPLKARSRG
jgi:hypothetical protein